MIFRLGGLGKGSAKNRRGFTIVDILLGLALAAVSYTALVNVLPAILAKKNNLYKKNIDVSTQVLRESLRTDLQTAGGSSISILEDSQLYICRYDQGSTNPKTCKPITAAQAASQGMDQKYCIASASPFNKPGVSDSMIQFFAYRGIDGNGQDAGGRLEYFFGEQAWGNRGSQKLIDVLSQVCKADFNSSFSQMTSSDWILMNTPSVNNLNAFMVCGASNNDLAQTLNDGPPNKCLAVVNQAPLDSTPGAIRSCTPGENGVSSLLMYYKFENKKMLTLGSSSSSSNKNNGSSEKYVEDVFVLPLLSLPCTNEDRDSVPNTDTGTPL